MTSDHFASDPNRPSGTPPSWSPAVDTAAKTARTALAGRVLVVAGAEVPTSDAPPSSFPVHIARANPALDATGLVVGGANWSETLKAVRRENPGLLLMVDPPSSDQLRATKDDPFPLDQPDSDTLFTPPLSDRLEAQISAGATVAITPTGHIEVGDRAALKAVIAETDKLDRDDVVVGLQLPYPWMTGIHLPLVVAAVSRSRHPVSITLCDDRSDPMSHPGVVAGVRQLAALEHAPIFHKVDLGGLDAMSYGALAATVGVLASKRRGGVPGKKGWAPRSNNGANVLLHDLGRFRRSRDIERDWYARLTPPPCSCPICDGRPLTRFGNERSECREAALHNALGIVRLATDAQAHGGFPVYWPTYVRDAIEAHARLGERIGARVDPPRQLEAWASRV